MSIIRVYFANNTIEEWKINHTIHSVGYWAQWDALQKQYPDGELWGL